MQATLASPTTGVQKPLTTSQPAARNIAVDAYRGFVMLLMMAEVLEFARVAEAYPGNWFWAFLGFNQTHVEWFGCSLHDLIQPSFSFLVGVALPYSIASRTRQRRDLRQHGAHAIWRSSSWWRWGSFCDPCTAPQTYFTFEDTLVQIGLGYPIPLSVGLQSRAGSGPHSDRSCLVTGWLGRCILRRDPATIIKLWACRTTGRTISPASPRTGTKTPISATPSISGS